MQITCALEGPNVTSEDYVTLLYQKFLGRQPDSAGLKHHVAFLDATGDLKLIVDKIIASSEFRDKQESIDLAPWIKIASGMGRPFVIVDVGAQRLDFEDHIYAPIMKSGLDWKCIGFEPIASRRLERIEAEADKRLIMLDAFIGDGKRHTFHSVTDSGSSSLLQLNNTFNADYEHISTLSVINEEEVDTKRLDDVLLEEPFIDFLKLDIQGFEKYALEGASKTLSRTNIIHVETLFAQMYERQGFFSDIDTLLRDAGFEFIDFQQMSRYRYINVPFPSKRGERLIWGDAFYARTLDLARDPPSSYFAQAAAASLIYNKPGLAQHILERGSLSQFLTRQP